MAKNSHLTLSDRIAIEVGLRERKRFSAIAVELGKDPYNHFQRGPHPYQAQASRWIQSVRYPQGIVQLYSCFDMLTKIAYELENPKACQDGYAKLSSTKILFGDKNRLNLDPSFTVFLSLKKRSISMVENLRNELVHNATWEMNPKIFRDTVDGVIRERFILMPDFTEEGTLVTFKNRKRFFADEKKVNIVKNREQLKNAKSRKLFLDLKYKCSTIIVR